MKLQLLLVACVGGLLPLHAQDRQPRPRVAQASSEFVPSSALEGNVTLQLKGINPTGSGIDLSMTGVGPQFAVDQLVGADDSLLHCELRVGREGSGYLVSYAISVRQRVATSVSKDSTNYEFRNVGLSGQVRCQPDTPVVILRDAGKALTLTLTEGGMAATE